MHTVFKFNQDIDTNPSKDNLSEELNLRKPISFFVIKTMSIVKILICSTHIVDLLCQVRVCIPIYKMYMMHFNLSTYVH